MTSTVLVTGATGHQGFGTVRHLLAAKVNVHALVRNLSSPVASELEQLGAKLCLGSFDDVESLRAAAHGTTAVFLNVSPSFTEPELELRQAKNVIQAAKDAGSVTTIVYSSVLLTGKHELFPNWGPDFPMAWYFISKAEIESLVQSSGFKNWTILRPASLMYNYVLPFSAIMFPELAKDHVLLTAYKPDTALMVLDPNDVGKFAAAAILEPETYNHQEIDLGIEALTPSEIAGSLSKAGGKEIKTKFYSAAEAAAVLEVNPMIAMQLVVNEIGSPIVDVKALERFSIKLTTFDEYLKREKGAVHNTFG